MDVAGEAPSEKTETSSAPTSTREHLEDFILPDIGEGIVECEL
jgi:2-oxoisovalerate dehydrogenase E2 component (dihydrolipoyl transacylase)